MHYHHFLYKKPTLGRQRHSFIWAFLSNGPCEPTLPSAALFVDHSNDGQIVDTFCDALLEEEGISHHLHWRQFCWVETPPLESCHKNRKKNQYSSWEIQTIGQFQGWIIHYVPSSSSPLVTVAKWNLPQTKQKFAMSFI